MREFTPAEYHAFLDDLCGDLRVDPDTVGEIRFLGDGVRVIHGRSFLPSQECPE